MKGKRDNPQPTYSRYQLQKAFVEALSIPKRSRKKWNPCKKWRSGVRKSALRGKCTKKVEELAQPLPRRLWGPSEDVIPPIRKATLKCKTPEWNLINGLPKMLHVSTTLKSFRKLGSRQRNAARNTLQKILDLYRTNYPPEGHNTSKMIGGAICHIKCVNIKKKRVLHKRVICQLNKGERKKFQIRMIRMGLPIKKPKPPKPDRGTKKPVAEMDLQRLAQPKPFFGLSPRDPFKIPESALKAAPTDWILNLAKHREPRPPPVLYDFRGNELMPPRDWDIDARRKVVASERTVELATPKASKKKMADDTKADPFRVCPAALKAVCSARLAELALPKVRD